MDRLIRFITSVLDIGALGRCEAMNPEGRSLGALTD